MTERLLNDQVVGQINEAFQRLKEPVEILFFGRRTGCETCEDTQQLAQEVAGLSDRLSFSLYDLDEHADLAQKFKVDKAPGMVLAGRKADPDGNGGGIQDFGVRYAGVPSGYEFSSFIQDLILVSGRESLLSQPTRDFLKEVHQPVLLQVFVTPT